MTYTITPASTNGGTPLTPATGVTGLTQTFTGLTLGRAYTFSVVAVNSRRGVAILRRPLHR